MANITIGTFRTVARGRRPGRGAGGHPRAVRRPGAGARVRAGAGLRMARGTGRWPAIGEVAGPARGARGGRPAGAEQGIGARPGPRDRRPGGR
ncbi:hypothetical protein TBS_03040 [Thermobispora bispora]